MHRAMFRSCLLMICLLLVVQSAGLAARVGSGLENPATLKGLSNSKLSFKYMDLYGIGLDYYQTKLAMPLSRGFALELGAQRLSDREAYPGWDEDKLELALAKELPWGLAVGTKVGLDRIQSVETRFDTKVDLGVAWRLNAPLTINFVAGDLFGSDRLAAGQLQIGGEYKWERLSVEVNLNSRKQVLFGMEYQLDEPLTVRAGLADGEASFGLGVNSSHWQVNYFFRPHQVGDSHSFELVRIF